METLTRPQAEQQLDYEHRAKNDAETWLAETLEGSMRTPFAYQFDGHELYADDGGALREIFDTAIRDAERINRLHPNLAFELRRRKHEKAEYEDMIKMAKGELPNTMVVISDFPPELMDATKDVGGYNAARRQTMLRVLSWRDGQMIMQSQSLDLSDRQALEAIYTWLGKEVPQSEELLGERMHLQLDQPEQQEFLIDELTGVYDRSLQSQFGGSWYAGRENEQRRNTYEFVCRQQDLVNLLAYEYMDNGYDAPMKYGIAAELETRYSQACASGNYDIVAFVPEDYYNQKLLLQDVHNAAVAARAAGKTYSGCGSSIGPDGNAEAQLDDSGYGNKSSEKSSYSFDKKMYCVVCQEKPKGKENKKLCGPCGICKGCDVKMRARASHNFSLAA